MMKLLQPALQSFISEKPLRFIIIASGSLFLILVLLCTVPYYSVLYCTAKSLKISSFLDTINTDEINILF